MNQNYDFKGTDNGSFGQQFDPKNYVKILNAAYNAVLQGAMYFKQLSSVNRIFEDKSLNSRALNVSIVEAFKSELEKDEAIKHRLRLFQPDKQYYFLVDRKFFLCFKQMGKNGVIQNMITKRHGNILAGNDFRLKATIRAELSKLGIVGTPPVIFVVFDREGSGIVDIVFHNYYAGEVAMRFRIDAVNGTGSVNIRPKSIDDSEESKDAV